MINPLLQRCPECAAAMRHETRADTVTDAGLSAVVDVPGWWCTRCDEAILDGEGLRLRERAFIELNAAARTL
jgi:YgiT-type zinc finger domain-containing protein